MIVSWTRRTLSTTLAVLSLVTSTAEGGAMPGSEVISKLPPDGGPSYNRLVFEKSPYLLQHASNPVDWYPWGEEAFSRARREDKPIFLSIGYATCHWCHVMERESFEDPEVARILNTYFVAIKVDREERPDVDNVYMTACQALTGSGGWPLTILMTAEKKPFFAGTYFPRVASFGRPGLIQLLENVRKVWEEQRGDVNESADRITSALAATVKAEPGGLLPASIEEAAYMKLLDSFDKRFAGFGSAPKFPIPHQLIFLLRYGHQRNVEEALNMVRQTLRAIRRGGIYDHVGFGVHRYSTDRQYLLPHFEKMLYDQALLSLAYLEAYQALGDDEFRQTAQEIFSYVLRDMTHAEGGFYSAEDADSEGEEGKFYVWDETEIRSLLGPSASDLVISRMNVQAEGNYRDESSGHPTGKNILYLEAHDEGVTIEDTARRLLFEARDKRVHPLKDDKILTSWNGLMIAALARGGRVLGKQEYIDAAEKAARFVLTRMRENHHLLRRYRDGQAALPGYLDDYAFLVWGLIELYEADFHVAHLRMALDLTDSMVESFWDVENGGFLFSGNRNEQLLAPFKPVYDGALPSGNSVALWNMVRLARMTARKDYSERVENVIRAFSNQVQEAPQAFSLFLIGVNHYNGPSREIVIVGHAQSEDTRQLLHTVNRKYLPNHSLILRGMDNPELSADTVADYLGYYDMRNGRATAYVCENFSCKNPVNDPTQLSSILDR